MLDAKTRTRKATLATLERLWDVYGGPTDAHAAEFVRRASAVLSQSLTSVAAQYAMYARAWRSATGVIEPPSGFDIDRLLADVRKGTTVEDRMLRPIVEVRTRLAAGDDFARASQAGLDRLMSIAGTDVQQTFRLAHRAAWAGHPKVNRYRRVLRGEVNCGLCIVASAQTYRSDRLLPIHPSCDCGVSPVIGGSARSDVSRDVDVITRELRANGVQVNNRGALANLRLDDATLDALRAVDEHQHGELGPLLKVAKHRANTPRNFTPRRREFDDTGVRVRGPGVADELLAEFVDP